MGKQSGSHDIGITNDSGAELGLTLVRQNGVPVYQETSDPALADQFFSGDIGYSRLPAEKELRLSGGDHRSGFGLQYAGQSTTRYHTGLNIDARFRENLILGALPTTVTTTAGVSAAASISNADCEAAANWTNGARSGTQAYTGTYSWSVGNGAEAYQDAVTWATDWQSDTFYFQMYVWAGTASIARIGLNDGVTSTYSSYHTGSSGWELLTVSMALAANATRLRLLLKAEAGSSTQYFDDAVLSSPAYGAYTAQADFNNIHYLSKGNMLLKQDAGGTSYSIVRCFPNLITDLLAIMVSGTDYLLIGQGWDASTTSGLPGAYWYMTTGEAFTMSTATANTIKFVTQYSGTIYGANTNSTVVSTTNPLNGGTAWANSKQIGDDVTNIVDLKSLGGLTYIKKSDNRVYYLNNATPASASVITLMNDIDNLSGTNTARMCLWRESLLVIPKGKQGLITYDGTDLTVISPTLFSTNASDFSGQIQAVSGDDQWLYVVIDNSTKVEVMAAREENVDGAADWRWHPLAEITITNCASAMISSHVKKRLWVGSDTGTESLYYIPVTTKYGDIANDSDYTYKTNGYLITPFYHFNLMGDNKAFIKLTLRMSGATANIYWDAYYRKLGDTVWVQIDVNNTFKVPPSTTRYIAANDTAAVTSTMIQFKFVGITNDTTISPVLIGWDAQAIWYPTERKLISCMVYAEDNIPNVMGEIDETLGSAIRETLNNLNSSGWPRAFYPPYWTSTTDTLYVKKLPLPSGSPQLEMIKVDKNSTSQWVYRLFLESVPVA